MALNCDMEIFRCLSAELYLLCGCVTLIDSIIVSSSCSSISEYKLMNLPLLLFIDLNNSCSNFSLSILHDSGSDPESLDAIPSR